MKLKTIAAAVVALTALSSHAAITDWAVHDDPLEIGANFAMTAGSFFDTYSFSLSGNYNVTSGAVTTFGNIVGAAYNLYSFGADGVMGTADDVGLGAWTFGSTPATHTVALGSGQYFYTVTGGNFGPAAYSLSSTIVAAPVPEPETYAMLAAGLGIIGFVASRRRRDF